MYCATEDGPGGQIFIIARFVHVLPCSKDADCFVCPWSHKGKHRTGRIVKCSSYEQQRDFDSMYREDHGCDPL